LFERLDFQIAEEEILPYVTSMLRGEGFGKEYAPAVAEMVERALEVPVTAEGAGLRSVPERECLREMEFTFRLGRFRTEDVRRILADPPHGLPEEFRQAATRMQEKDVAGFMTGAIDLLFRQGGKYYLLDYKSNFLGDSPSSYQLPRLREAMAREHYYVQYLIYTVALHRYLRQRVAGYSYERDFGGAVYLFLRGMPEGVFADRPSASLIAALEGYFAGGGG
jgi:exodeoxyribonuclease V beta subunit